MSPNSYKVLGHRLVNLANAKLVEEEDILKSKKNKLDR